MPETITFEGVNIQNGDFVDWVPESATGCGPTHVRGAERSFVGSSSAVPTFTHVGVYVLCYKFNFREQPFPSLHGPSPFLLFPAIRVSVVRIDAITPTGTAPDCASNLTISGSGFTQLADVGLACSFDPLPAGTPPLVSTHFENDTMVSCTTPDVMALGVASVRLVRLAPTSNYSKLVTQSFVVFDLSATCVFPSPCHPCE